MAELRLKVAEAIQDDVNKGIVRIDSGFMRDIDVKPGDIVELEGARKTVAIVDRSYPGDIGLQIIRMDGLLRKNAKTSIGDHLKVTKAQIKEAKKVTIAPAREGVIVKIPPNMFKQGLLGRAVMKGDIISLGGARNRRVSISGNPYDEMFNIINESIMGGVGLGFGDLKFIVVDVNPKGGVIVSNNTELQLNPEAMSVEEESIPEVSYEDVGGLEEEVKKVREMIELPLKHPEIFERLGVEPPKGVLLHGPPGTGKTLLAKAVANETNAHFILINGPEIVSKFYGESEKNLRAKFEEAEKNAPAIIFFDEIDAIASKREETRGEVEKRIVAQLLSLMDGLKTRGKVVVIAATNIPNSLDPALRRPGRFDRELSINAPKKEGRLNILKIHTRNMPFFKDVKLKEIAGLTHGFVGADLSSLAKEAAMIRLREVLPEIQYDKEEQIPKEVLEKLFIKHSDFKDALKVVRPSALREVLVETPNVKWTDIGGLEQVKEQLVETITWPLTNSESFKRLGIRAPRGILLYGPPGTGKTLLAKAIATESESNFISIKGPSLLSMWVGESERGVRKIFEKARQASPSIIFFDEIDALAPRRGTGSDNHVTERVVNQLLTEMDGLDGLQDVIIIGATNRPDIIDPALLRPGRFDRIILTPAPDKKGRIEILKVHTKKIPINFESLSETYEPLLQSNHVMSALTSGETISEHDINTMSTEKIKRNNIHGEKNILSKQDTFLSFLAENTEGFVGADIEALCREAAIMALREDMKAKEVTKKHFEDALKIVHPSVTPEVTKTYQDIEGQFKSSLAKQVKENMPVYFG